MKHLKVFNSLEEFTAVRYNLKTPYVVLNKQTGEVICTNLPEIKENGLITEGYVDLGLPSGTLWAACNLGASSPCAAGNYYQWGATDGYTGNSAKANSDWDTCPWGQDVPTLTVLDNEHDAVYQATNGEAHMPSLEQAVELKNLGGTWCVCTFYGDNHTSHTVYGVKFVGNGNVLFIPARGFYAGKQFLKSNSEASIWTNTLHESITDRAYHFYGDSLDADRTAFYYRCAARNIRGVK